MYFSIVFLFIFLLAFVIGCCRRRSAIKKVCLLSLTEKCDILEPLLTPMGYCYHASHDVITSHDNAWQREFGYQASFDAAAPHLNMVFDHLPVYFDYKGRTWLIEFWKGQYGINTGAEIGIYYADGLVSPSDRERTHFSAAADTDLLPMAMSLSKKETTLATLSKRTWWLTSFSMGRFSHPSQLYLSATISFPNCEMLNSFLRGLSESALSPSCIQTCRHQVYICFCGPIKRKDSFFTRLARGLSQFTNRLFCRLYLMITKPFCLTIDRLLYLYYLLPFCFRRTLRLRRYKKKWHRHN